MYQLTSCPDCIYSTEIKVADLDDITFLYLCHNKNSREYGIFHADFFECRLTTYENKHCREPTY